MLRLRTLSGGVYRAVPPHIFEARRTQGAFTWAKRSVVPSVVDERPLRARLPTNPNRQLWVMLDQPLEQFGTAELGLGGPAFLIWGRGTHCLHCLTCHSISPDTSAPRATSATSSDLRGSVVADVADVAEVSDHERRCAQCGGRRRPDELARGRRVAAPRGTAVLAGWGRIMSARAVANLSQPRQASLTGRCAARPGHRLARISHTSKCIEARNQRKLLCSNNLQLIAERPDADRL